MRSRKYVQHLLIGATAVVFVGARIVSGDDPASPVVAEAASVVNVERSTVYLNEASKSGTSLANATQTALAALAGSVRQLSHPAALENAFASYYAFRDANPGQVKKPYLYYVDYGLPSTAPRGYVFDMDELTIVRGPFTVAHGRGSARPSQTVPTRFSNAHGSNATSLGLYLAQETYRFSGKASGRRYTSVGLRLKGLSNGFNDNARTRGVVAHGAPYVTATRAGRSEGCPAMTQALANELLPKIANGGMVFLFAPDTRWMASDKWVAAGQKLASGTASPAARAN